MKVYFFDHEGLFIGEGNAQKDPLESEIAKRDVFLIPAQATNQKPPLTADNEILRWTGSLWITEVVPPTIEEEESDV